MNLIDFNRQFPNEEACQEHLKATREQQGVIWFQMRSYPPLLERLSQSVAVQALRSSYIAYERNCHALISNAKRQLLDVFHSVDEDYLQSYLDEFCYKFNRRYMDLFERLMVASVSYQNRFMY